MASADAACVLSRSSFFLAVVVTAEEPENEKGKLKDVSNILCINFPLKNIFKEKEENSSFSEEIFERK